MNLNRGQLEAGAEVDRGHSTTGGFLQFFHLPVKESRRDDKPERQRRFSLGYPNLWLFAGLARPYYS